MSMHNKVLARIQAERKAVTLLYGSSTESVTEQRVCKMAWDLFPLDVTSNPASIYLDYACGKGSLLLYGVEVLFNTLRTAIKDPQQRLTHIIKCQLFGCDVSKGQTDIARSALRRMLLDPSAQVNIECCDSLTKNFHTMNKKFNLVTNVPFQSGKDTNFYKKFRVDLNEKLADILEYKVIISPNYMTITNKGADISRLAIYKDLGNAFESITLPAGVCVTREDPNCCDTVEFTDLNGKSNLVPKEEFVVLADVSILPLIKQIQKGKTLDSRYIHDTTKLDNNKENTEATTFYVDRVGETNNEVKGFMVDEIDGKVHEGSFVVFAYNASGDPLAVGNKKLGPTKVLPHGRYIFSGSVVALKFNTDVEASNCKKLLDSEWSKNIIRAVKYATNNSKTLLSVLPDLDFTQPFNERSSLVDFS